VNRRFFIAQTSLLSNQTNEALGGGWDTSQLPSEKMVAAKNKVSAI
jgi:hypothetical protein